ncbi:EcsC family protein [Clostridium luticellarii]|jgi:hypothetical protein|uniref:EcsC protein family protein n=1 Tax=Clostridium luticellarii TaxID=1691940 RepID=A0A2T0BGV7_9CLOT|nr:EcsC family protein [Clostridium luticellarii]MCI1943950.1 EcsC family protein [Clostridium luticellarii]MCI1967211.1 EcsC family protein [Clostridium luticellarii]MCI1995942.1 EcsC family protein [Clostridium luticellarii]MCI2038469.1 EcsC family protein [Clostridium luticellarii]PRR83088.1 EcsC protein family protein [Clostridium luticellarii]
MSLYEDRALEEMLQWRKEMTGKPGFTNDFTKKIQDKLNGFIPEKGQHIITKSIENMVKTVIYGYKYISGSPVYNMNLESREDLVRKKMKFYRNTAAVSGAGTGGAGIIVGLADFPILLGLKMKFLFDAAGIYSFNVKNYRERLYILYIFQIAFSSQNRRREVYDIISDWDNYCKTSLPENKDNFDWKTFQQEYRDYIDIAKMLQIVPGIGAAIGAYANYKLMEQLGNTAMNAYRLRIFKL